MKSQATLLHPEHRGTNGKACAHSSFSLVGQRLRTATREDEHEHGENLCPPSTAHFCRVLKLPQMKKSPLCLAYTPTFILL